MKRSVAHLPLLPVSLIFALLLAGFTGLSRANRAGAEVSARTCYVKWNASGNNDGSSWAHAYSTVIGVKTALADATCSQIWVAAGAYLPGAIRADSFHLKSGVALYGGFAGNETSPDDRDIVNNETFLSGNIGASAAEDDNTYHVVSGSGADSTAVLDGFTVIGGHGNSSVAPQNRGGGLYTKDGSPTIRNVTFKDNFAVLGGAIYNENSDSELAGLLFVSNAAAGGGGMYNNTSNVTVVNATFSGNSAINGAGVYNHYSGPTITNVTLTGNAASDNGGGLYNYHSDPEIANTILWGNTAGIAGPQILEGEGAAAKVASSVVEGGFPSGRDIITKDPKLGVLGNHGGRMQAIPLNHDSSAIDAGSASVCPYSDQRGFSRSGQGAGCDIGACEYQPLLYAVPGGRADGFCHSWSFGCDLQYALSSADWAQEVWVKYGLYKPTSGRDRSVSFELPPAVRVYGGFAGTETSLEQRQLDGPPSLLSGDIGVRADSRDNSYHVVSMTSAFFGLDTILDGFTISYGNANGSDDNAKGGGMYLHSANPILRNIHFADNQAVSAGGGLNVQRFSDATLQDVVFDGNRAFNGGGLHAEQSTLTMTGVDFDSNRATGQGGGLNALDASLAASKVRFTRNTSEVYGGGAYITDHSTGQLTNVDFVGNTAANRGGGLHVFSKNQLTLYRVTFTENEALLGGGLVDIDNALQLISVSFMTNRASEAGGGLYVNMSSPALNDVTFHANRAGGGGGMYTSDGSPELLAVGFTQNEAFDYPGNDYGADGGGMLNDHGSAPKLNDVRFVLNSAERDGGGMANLRSSHATVESAVFKWNFATWLGGGVYNSYSNMTLVNATFAKNWAYDGAGLHNYFGDELRINHATFAGNEASDDGGGLVIEHSETPEIRNSIFWDNKAADLGAQIHNMPAHSGWGNQSLRASVIQDGCPPDMACTNIIVTDPVLAVLGNYGSNTEVFPLGEGSSAIDAAEYLDCPATDQRGIKRPQGSFCDIGAYESRFYYLHVDKNGSGGVSGDGIYCGPTCEKAYPEITRVKLAAEPAPGSFFAGWSGACSGSGNCTTIMSMPRNVTANFDPVPSGSYALAVNVAGSGRGTVTGNGIACHAFDGADCTEVYGQGAKVSLTADPGYGSNFTGWSGSCSGSAAECLVTMDEAKAVTATFAAAGNPVFVPLVIR